MLNRIVLNDEDRKLLNLLSRDLTEEEMAKEMDRTLVEFTLLIKKYHDKFGTKTLHGLEARLMVFGGQVSFYDLSHAAKIDPNVHPEYDTTL